MYIKKGLPQFEDKKTLLVVTGSEEAIFYIAHNGQIEEKERVEVSHEDYINKDAGLFKSSSKGVGTMKAGTVYKENFSDHITKEFLDRLEKKIKEVFKKEHIKSVYLFCPDYMKKQILKKTPKNFQKMLHITKLGNYVHSHPFELLESIQEEEDEKKEKTAKPIKEKALKILKRTGDNSKNEEK